MPSGVASHFLDILGADRRACRTRAVVGGVLGVVFLGLAHLLMPLVGMAVHAGAYLVGALLGVLAGRMRVRKYEASIRGTWTQWMRYAPAAESVAELHRKVHGRSGRNLPYLYAAVLFVFWGVEATLVVLALLRDAGPTAVLSVPAIAFNGLLAGVILGHGLTLARWIATFRASVTEMVESGEINVWGLA